jgi:hypothetical protein
VSFGFTRAEFWTATPAELALLADTHRQVHDPDGQRPAGLGRSGADPRAQALLGGLLSAAAKGGGSDG